jgi:hypothetical protein
MSDAAMMLRELSYPWQPGERIKNILDRTSRMCRLSYWRTYDIWYRKARRIESYELAQIAEALRIKNERAARNEFHELKIRLARLETALLARDPDFHSEDVDVLRALSREPGGTNGSLGRRGLK